MLANEVYMSDRDWDKNGRRGDQLPISGKKRLVKNDPSQWIHVDGWCEALIERALWDRVQKRLKDDYDEYKKSRTGNVNKKYLLSGLLKCGSCGHSFGIGSKGRKGYVPYHCAYRARHGAQLCNNKTIISQPGIEKRVKDTLDAIIKDPQQLQDLVADHNRNVTRLNQSQLGLIDGLEMQLTALLKKQSNFADAIGDGAKIPQILASRLQEVEEEIVAVKNRIGDSQAEIKPLMAAQLRTPEDYTTGTTSIFSNDLERDRQFLETVLDSITIGVDGSVVINFQEENLFTPLSAVEVGGEIHDLASARTRHQRGYSHGFPVNRLSQAWVENPRAFAAERDGAVHYFFGGARPKRSGESGVPPKSSGESGAPPNPTGEAGNPNFATSRVPVGSLANRDPRYPLNSLL